MIFKVGDRIYAKEGVCPGHYGVVTGFDGGYPESTDVIMVTYDNGRKDHIYGRMIEIGSPSDFEMDA